MNNLIKISNTINNDLKELSSMDLALASKDGTLAADLHSYYNQVGLKEGWLKSEYATPLSKQDTINQQKNVDAARNVVEYWAKQLLTGDDNLVDEMKKCVDYESNRELPILEAAADAQHIQWQKFVNEYQKERITPGDENFRENNYEQFISEYKDLSTQIKDQDRLIVAVITDRILAKADIGYIQKINVG